MSDDQWKVASVEDGNLVEEMLDDDDMQHIEPSEATDAQLLEGISLGRLALSDEGFLGSLPPDHREQFIANLKKGLAQFEAEAAKRGLK